MDNHIYEMTGQNKRHKLKGSVYAHFTKSSKNQDLKLTDHSFSFVVNQESLKELLEMTTLRNISEDFEPETIAKGYLLEMVGILQSQIPFIVKPVRTNFAYHGDFSRPSFFIMTLEVLEKMNLHFAQQVENHRDFKFKVNEDAQYKLFDAELELVGILEEDEYKV